MADACISVLEQSSQSTKSLSVADTLEHKTNNGKQNAKTKSRPHETVRGGFN